MDARGIKPLYNGNIAETFWRTSTDNVLRKYSYSYDALSRLNEAIYQRPWDAVPIIDSYNESISYDKNGNIAHLQRKGNVDSPTATFIIDELDYTYDHTKRNQLMKVADSSNNPSGFKDVTVFGGDDYTYDDNGNMTKDANKNINLITYNHLNLPVRINFGGSKQIRYLYNAVGEKVKKTVTSDTIVDTTEYMDSFHYNNNVLQFFPTTEGYVNYTAGASVASNYNYVYNYLDHLGNIRLSYTRDPRAGILKTLQENHYYPFGLRHANYNIDEFHYVVDSPWIGGGSGGSGGSGGTTVKIDPVLPGNVSYKYKYNGKELQDELGLNLYDYGARNYDPALGRFMNMDPLAELSRRWTPYNYAYDNPMYFVDPDGMLSESFINELIEKSGEGKTKWTNNENGTFSGSNGASINAGENEQQVNANDDGDGNKGDGDKEKNKNGKKSSNKKPSYTPPPKVLPGFPDAEKVKRKGGRPRWRLPDGDIIEWDGQHGELERYNPRGKHKGVWSPDGEEIKDPVPGRTIDPNIAPPSPTSNGGFMDTMSKATGLSGTALIIYIIFSEGSRAFPPRNLVPIP